MINGIEGLGDENDSKVLSLVSVTDRQQFERIYGKADQVFHIKLSILSIILISKNLTETGRQARLLNGN